MTDFPDQTNNGPPAGSEGAIAGIPERLARGRERIDAAAKRAGRDPKDVLLVAVTKTHPVPVLRAAIEAGLRDLGESRVQEALGKLDAIGGEARWHLVGHLQRKKVNAVVGRFDLIHSVDSIPLIEALERRAAALELTQRILFQINVSGELSKHGASPEHLPDLLQALTRAPHLRVEGLMTIPPFSEDPEQSRSHFARLRQLLLESQSAPQFVPRYLSMGMSGDFEVAIEEGATIVRIGTAIFGPRSPL